MPVPTTLINFQDIYREANNNAAVPSGSNMPTAQLFGFSYFDGPNGNSTLAYNAWGIGSSDIIYGAASSDYSWGNFSGLRYFYDNSTYNMTYKFNNNGSAPSDDFNVRVYLLDNATTSTYTWADTNTVSVGAGSSTGTVTFSVAGFGGTPLLNTNFWVVETSDSRGYTGTGTFDVYANGIFQNSLPLSPGFNTYDCNAAGGAINVGYNSVNGFTIEFDMFP
jgi:hypothetical protein